MTNKNKFRLAIIGNKGLPADLPGAGGGERGAEAIATGLAKRGHLITMYCRWHYNRHPPLIWKNVHLKSLPSIKNKNFDTLIHSFLSTIHIIMKNTADIVVSHGMGSALYLPLLKLFGKKTAVYLDGVDWERPKWGKIAKFVLKVAAKFAFAFADEIIVDNRVSQKIFENLYNKQISVITLGADIWDYPGDDLLSQWGLIANEYILFIGFLKPDKGVHTLIKAYNELDTDFPLVIVGDSADEREYVKEIKQISNKDVKFLGFVYGNAARQLYANCFIYVQPSLMEGNSPSLMSAMACGRCVVVSGIEQNLETIGKAGIAFKSEDYEDLKTKLEFLLNNPDKTNELGDKALKRIKQVYNWEIIINQFENLYVNLISKN